VVQKWYSYNPCPVSVVSLVPFVSPFSKKIKNFSSTQKKPYIDAFYALTIWDNLIESIPDNRHIISDRGSWCKGEEHESRDLQGWIKEADIGCEGFAYHN
jgi:hypothetical protein